MFNGLKDKRQLGHAAMSLPLNDFRLCPVIESSVIETSIVKSSVIKKCLLTTSNRGEFTQLVQSLPTIKIIMMTVLL